jgi:hypothetical protein
MTRPTPRHAGSRRALLAPGADFHIGSSSLRSSATGLRMVDLAERRVRDPLHEEPKPSKPAIGYNNVVIARSRNRS